MFSLLKRDVKRKENVASFFGFIPILFTCKSLHADAIASSMIIVEERWVILAENSVTVYFGDYNTCFDWGVRHFYTQFLCLSFTPVLAYVSPRFPSVLNPKFFKYTGHGWTELLEFFIRIILDEVHCHCLTFKLYVVYCVHWKLEVIFMDIWITKYDLTVFFLISMSVFFFWRYDYGTWYSTCTYILWFYLFLIFKTLTGNWACQSQIGT